MADDFNKDSEEDDDLMLGGDAEAHSDYVIPDRNDESVRFHLPGMYQNWYLDYASYVILDRSVPHVSDGLKPVQRRILHTMKELDDGRYNKVANIVGATMSYHPHGDASIKDALVNLGQNDLLIDCQGNWGNILTGDEAAAARYIEARLSKFALEVLYSPKITEWELSYDGRHKEPVTLPVKFPLLLAQGVEGIAVGLSSKILPHNFNEILDASIAYLRGEDFLLYPDFPTGGSIDVSKYNDGCRGGSVKIRAKISKLDNKTLVITEIPFGKTTTSIKESILKANERGKIKLKNIDDNTAATAEIVIHLPAGVSPDKTIDALYACTDCEVRVSPNCCVIQDQKPQFTTVSKILRDSTDQTKDILRRELGIQREELLERLFFISLEKWFIEERIYKEKEYETAKDKDTLVAFVDKKLEPLKPKLIREVTREDIEKLFEIRMIRITKFNSDKANDTMKAIKADISDIDYNLTHLVDYTISWFEMLKEKYGEGRERKTEIRNFETIMETKVVEANQKLYINREEGFIGTNLKHDEFVCNCSDIDDVIIFFKDGKYKIMKVADKLYVGKNIIHIAIFKRNDKRTVYNAVYRDGKSSLYYMKRFSATGLTRNKEYDITQGKEGSRIVYFTANPNGEAEVIKVLLKPKARMKVMALEKNFGDIAIKGRQSRGNLLSKNEIAKITLKQRGGSTLGGRKVWFDMDVARLNYDGRGELLGEFVNDDLILVIYKNGDFYTCNFDASNHFDPDILRIEKFKPHKIWSVALYDAEQKYDYIKRFKLEPSNKRISFLGENPQSSLILISDEVYPLFKVVYGGDDAYRESQTIDVSEFVGEKSFKAKGKRISTWNIAEITELPPERFPEESEEIVSEYSDDEEDAVDEDELRKEHLRQEILNSSGDQESDDSGNDLPEAESDENGQMSLF